MTGIRHLQPVPPAAATGLVAAVYAQAEREFGLLPPIPLHSPVPRLLAGSWCVLRENLLAGRVARPVKEALAAAVSRLNRCPYCVEAHTLMLAAGKPGALRDEPMRRMVEWGAAHRSPGSPALAAPPFSREDAAEMIGTASAFHYINRMAHVFLPESPFPPAARWMKGWVRRMAAGRFAERVQARREAGASLGFLEDAALPDDLPWAAGNPGVAGAYARFAQVVGEAVEGALPERVQEIVVEQLDGWDGADPGFGTEWLAAALARLPEEDRAAGRLALLTALASYRVDDATVAAYRRRFPEDRQLLGAVSWSSYVASRRIALWLWEGGKNLPAV